MTNPVPAPLVVHSHLDLLRLVESMPGLCDAGLLYPLADLLRDADGRPDWHTDWSGWLGQHLVALTLHAQTSWWVLSWTCAPNEDDGLIVMDRFASEAEALAFLSDPPVVDTTIQYHELVGPGCHQAIANPSYRPASDDDSDWRSEAAQQAGMGLGIGAYNDAMGYDCEPPYESEQDLDDDGDDLADEVSRMVDVMLGAAGVQWPTDPSLLNDLTGLPCIAWLEEEVPYPTGKTLARLAELAARFEDDPCPEAEQDLRTFVASAGEEH